MHTIISDECTGCDLCVAPCPVDCIKMVPIAQTTNNWQWDLNSIEITMIDDSNIAENQNNNMQIKEVNV
ncbi:electron transport complex protein RnfB [compost metagenome]